MPVLLEADFSVKEKDEASPSRQSRRDLLNAFILRFAGVWRLFVSRPCAGLSTVNPLREPVSRGNLKDQLC
jgi:hypothetical protein